MRSPRFLGLALAAALAAGPGFGESIELRDGADGYAGTTDATLFYGLFEPDQNLGGLSTLTVQLERYDSG